MGLASHILCVYDPFSSYHVSFSLMMILPMMVLCPGHLVRALFHEITSVVSVAEIMLVVSGAEIPLVVYVTEILLVV